MLREDSVRSYRAISLSTAGDFWDNRIICSDNLTALQLLQEEFQRKIKCVYIDPPYNTGNMFTHYRDELVHEHWLSMMRPRLELLWSLLRDDGFLAVQIDDNEFARLYLLMAEICQERNLKVIVVKMAEPTGVKMSQVVKHGGIARLKEYLILAGKSGIRGLSLERIPKEGWDNEYRIGIENVTRGEMRQLKALIEKKIALRRISSTLMRSVASSSLRACKRCASVNRSLSSMRSGCRKMPGALSAPAQPPPLPNDWPTTGAQASNHTCRHLRLRPRKTNSM